MRVYGLDSESAESAQGLEFTWGHDLFDSSSCVFIGVGHRFGGLVRA